MSENTGLYKVHPIDKISHVRHKIEFLAGVTCEGLNLSEDGESGLYWILRDMEKELKEALAKIEDLRIPG